jgi:serine protease inhibitor
MRVKGIVLSLLVILVLASSVLINISADSKSRTTKQGKQKQGKNSEGSSPFIPGKQTDTKPMEQSGKTKVDSRLIAADIKFGFNLYSHLTKRGADKNIFVSPASIALALAMTYNGANGETRQAMTRALELQGLTLAEINAANAQLKTALENADPKVKLEIANSLWAREGVQFQPEFVKANRDFYQAEVAELDFNQSSAVATINAWVSKSTHGKIDKIVDQIGRDTLLFLINAIYFKGSWSEKFDATRTKEENFTLATGKQMKHPLMSQSGSYAYFETDKFQAAALPYGDKHIRMYLFLPNQNSTLAEFHKSLNAQSWADWMPRFTQMKGDISLPRFKVEYETTLKGVLSALGMGAAFDEDADFSAMLKPPARAFISEVKHKAFAEVNEEGTEAAAVTSVEMRTTSLGPPPKTFRMVVDRPFFFAIRDDQTGAVLFMGSIAEPK